ncbi:MAG: NAD(+) diphosphatase [Bauldia sp.]|nr:MAG: NAD(+) diphosphatase [Bauldia sp.]
MASLFDDLPQPEASSLTGFAGNRIDRRSESRDEDSVPSALADPAAMLYLFRADQALLRSTNPAEPLFTFAEAARLGTTPERTILLGWTPAGPRLAAQLADETAIDEAAIRLADLRSLAVEGTVAPDHLGALAQARALCYWHARHGFCAVCGAPTAMRIGGYRRDCPACGAQHFPRTDPVVIMLAVDAENGGDRCLMGRQARFAPGMYSCLAGFLEPGETIEDAVRRETREEAGITVGRVRYHASQPWPFPASLMIGCYAEATTTDIRRDETELEDCRWFSRDEVLAMAAGAHPHGLKVPPPMALANSIIRAWAEKA